MIETRPIAETDHFIVLDQYEKIDQSGAAYQTERDLENEFVRDLQAQGYEYRRDLNTHEKLLANVREQLQKLNAMVFSDGLPREIALRRRQYEYYREQLLNFAPAA